MSNHRKIAERSAKGLLIGLRKKIKKSGLDIDEFPRWVNGASIHIGKLNDGTILFFERGLSPNDQVVRYQKVDSDIEFFFPNQEADFRNCWFNVPPLEDSSDFPLVDDCIVTVNEHLGLTNFGTSTPHGFLLIYHVLGQYYVQSPEEPIAVRYLPFALFVPKNNLVFEKLWDVCKNMIFETMVGYLPSLVENYRTEPVEQKSIMASIEDTIIILGSYKEPFKSELTSVRDYLRNIGYDAFLIENLPETSEQSLSDKVRLWTTASRFCIMIDREASGHIKEYEIVKNQHKPLVFLRPKESGSTWMIGGDELVDINYINTFEFQDSPLEILDDSVKWAENVLTKRGETYPEFYPWKDK